MRMPAQDYEFEKKKIIEILSKEDLELIKKNYPIKRIRNAKIREIAQQMGGNYNVLADLSGLSQSQIWQIANYNKDIRKLSNDEQSLKNDLNKIQEAAVAFCKEIKKILKHRRK
jgi:hypothetical protein